MFTLIASCIIKKNNHIITDKLAINYKNKILFFFLRSSYVLITLQEVFTCSQKEKSSVWRH